MQKLRATYSRIRDLLGEDTEPFESVELVEAYRRFFKPETVRVVLLAESHVYTDDSERQIPILPVPSLSGYPDQYARFVYCLGYGEKSLTKSVNHPKRDGTPQFWKIFFSCCNPISSPDDFHGSTSECIMLSIYMWLYVPINPLAKDTRQLIGRYSGARMKRKPNSPRCLPVRPPNSPISVAPRNVCEKPCSSPLLVSMTTRG